MKQPAKFMVKNLLILVFIFLAKFLIAQPYQFAHIDFTQGLSNNQANCIYKDAHGFMWFGTFAGLNRYDGYSFKIFRHNTRDSSSLNDNLVLNIEEGPFGKIWVLTQQGFNIFDPSTEKFERNVAPFLKSLSLPETGLSKIVKTKNSFWFIYPDVGLFKYEQNKKISVLKHVNGDTTSINENTIADIQEDSQRNLWILHGNGMLEKLDTHAQKVLFRTNVLNKEIAAENLPFSLYIDAQDELWIYATGKLPGVYYYQPLTNKLTHFSKEAKAGRLSNNFVSSVQQDNKGLIWIGTDHGGINILNKKNFESIVLLNNPDDDKSIAQNVINFIYKDDLGIIWVGTPKKGISYYHESLIKFPLYKNHPSDPNSLGYDDVNRFLEDASGNIWLGTNGGGLIYFNRKTNTFKQFTHDTSNTNSLSNNVIISLYIDHNQTLWIGTYFGGLDSYDGKTFTHHKHNDSLPASIADDRVWYVYEDSENKLWIGTVDGGLDLFDREHNIFYHHKSGSPNSIAADYVPSIAEDAYKNLWVATANGISVLEKNTGKFLHYSAEENKLSNNVLISLLKDSRGNMWAGTNDGLNVFIESKKLFQSFTTENGLPDNTISSILEDDAHNLWVSTANGISKITVYGDQQKGFSITCKNYDELDGLQGREFNSNAGLKTKEGELLFGGPNGFNIFNPLNITLNKNIPPIVFTGLQVFNQNINAGEKIDDHVILQKAITETNEIILKYNENVFSIEFAALSYAGAQKNQYEYLLDGFNKQWLAVNNKIRKATYTNLDPGEYTFRVRASNDDGTWNSRGIAMKIIILPPWWKTTTAYVFYVLVIAAVLYFSRKMVIQRARTRFALEQERKEAQRIHELDMIKIKFFTNISHEFRTPLSLILTPLDKIINDTANTSQKTQFTLIQRNAKRLLNMVNQLLDFRKLEMQELKLHMQKGDIIKFIKELSYSFTDIAENKNIHFSFSSAVDSLYTNFDNDKIERIVFNLLSNAFKFTPHAGKISVQINVENSTKEAKNKLLKVEVTDTGIGIEKNKQEKIFERFFQNKIPGSVLNKGNGIGLAIAKEFAKMHNGKICVTSEPGNGSTFMLILPVEEMEPDIISDVAITGDKSEDVNIPAETIANANDPASKTKNVNSKKPVLLLIEDSEDFRFYLKDNLREYFIIAEAANGKEGWQKTLFVHPDLIVCDVSMPEMNGIDLCKKIKTDKRTYFIPVILLTALTQEEQQIKGLETGANDYITKPFNFEILLSKIRNLVTQQQSFKTIYQKQVQVHPADINVDSPDEKFIQEALEAMERNMSNNKYSVKELSRELHVSRVALYKKLLALTGKSPVEFIRSVRLKRAQQLLKKTGLTVAEISYEVGFNDPKQFSRYFKDEFGMLPSEMKASFSKEKT